MPPPDTTPRYTKEEFARRGEIEYPTSDGKPMAETTLHRRIMSDSIQALERRYRDVPDVWVGGNLCDREARAEAEARTKALEEELARLRGAGS